MSDRVRVPIDQDLETNFKSAPTPQQPGPERAVELSYHRHSVWLEGWVQLHRDRLNIDFRLRVQRQLPAPAFVLSGRRIARADFPYHTEYHLVISEVRTLHSRRLVEGSGHRVL